MGSLVTVRPVPSYEEEAVLQAAVADLFENAGAPQAIQGKKVLIKPNLLARHAPGAAVTTHPAVLRAVIRQVKQCAPADIVVADSSGGPYAAPLMKAVYKTSGLAEVCEQEGVRLHMGTGSGEKKGPGLLVHSFQLIDPVLECEYLIDLPKLKTHMMTTLSCAVKNLFGCVPGLMKAEFHTRFPDKERFGRMLVDLCETVRADLVVVDGIVAMEGDGPAGGSPRSVGIVMGGADLYKTDLAACRIMGIEPQRVPYLCDAIERGLCPQNFAPQEADDPAGLLTPLLNFKLPSSYHKVDFSDRAPTGLRWAGPLVIRLAAPRPKINRGRCIGCGNCASICPAKVITLEKGKAHIAPQNCIKCFCCHEMCPVKAIDVKRFSLFSI